MSEELQHLWIPDEEVEQLDKKLRGDSEDRGLDHSAHGETLSTGLRNIVTAYSHLENDSLSDEDIMIFKMVLPETEEIYSKRDIAEKEGLKINAVQDKHSAVVSTNKKMFTRLQERVGKYRETGGLKYFQYVDQFEPITAEDKRSKGLSRFLGNNKEELHVDVQIMLVPNLEEDMRAKAVSRLEQEIRSMNDQQGVRRYDLSDGTPVIRADVHIKDLERLEADSAIYRVEQTSFFHMGSNAVRISGKDLQLDPTVKPEELPLVAVLDSGVEFPDKFSELAPIHWKAVGVSGKGSPHGTEVASKVVFSHIGLQLIDKYVRPRARVVDCDIYGDAKTIATDEMSDRIAQAVAAFHDIVKIYNLSSNVEAPIEGSTLSIMGYQLDTLMRKYHVKFVVSAGNHRLAESSSTLEEILDDDDARIAEPADSMLSITVGAVAGIYEDGAFSKENEPTAYTRVGPGFAGFYKPDLVAYAANIKKNAGKLEVVREPYAIVMIPGGDLGLDAGTSFSAPVVAGDLAEVAATLPGDDVLLAEALLYNGAEKIWNTAGIDKETAVYLGNQYGRGLSAPENCKHSAPYRVTFLRTGSLKKATKEHVKFLMPTVQAAVKGNNTTKVTVTCITDSPIDKSKDTQYIGACITASLKKLSKTGKLASGNDTTGDNRGKWDTCNHFSKTFSGFSGGFWEVWLDLFTKWDIDEDMEIPYYLAITIEDLTKTNNIYQEVLKESAGRYKPISVVRVPVRV